MHFALKRCMFSVIALALLASPAFLLAESSVSHSSHTNQYAIVVYKSQAKLILFLDDKPIRTFHIAALGKNPVGHKTRKGDGKTPEGNYRLMYKNPKSICDRSLELNYPNTDDARRAFEHHLITVDQYLQIVRATENHTMPPQSTLLGGNVFIHGADHCMRHPEATHGCIALHNSDMEKLFNLVPLETPMTIKP